MDRFGIELLSRGAKEVVICDNSYDAIKIIKKNVDKTNFNDKAIVINKDYRKCLVSFERKKFDIILLDPPYKTDFSTNAIKMICELDLLNEDGIIIVETDDEKKVLDKLNEVSINIYDLRKYGRVKLIFLNRKG